MERYLRHVFAGPSANRHPISGGSVGLAAQFAVVDEWQHPRDMTVTNAVPAPQWEPWRRPMPESAVRLNSRPLEVTMEAALY